MYMLAACWLGLLVAARIGTKWFENKVWHESARTKVQ
jgi:hypothetical protein